MKLRNQMLLRCLCAAALVFGCFGALLIGQVFSLQLSREIHALDAHSAAVSRSLEAGTVNYALQSIPLSDDLLYDLLTQADGSAGLYTSDGTPFFGTLPTPMPQEGIYLSGRELHAVRPLHLNGEVYFLLMRAPLASLYEMRTSLIRIYSVLYLSLMALFALVMHLIARGITRPLEELTFVSRQLSGGLLDQRAPSSDCTEIAALSASFNAMADSLTGQIERQRRFIADLTHEMKTPLTAMLGHAELIRSERLRGEEVLTASHQIIKEGRRLNALSARLIDLILLEKDEIQPQELFARHLIEETVTSLLPEAQKQGIRLHGVCDDVLILGDNALLRVLLGNLTDNALKSGAGEVRIEGQLKDGIFTLTVSDDGRGMDEEALSRITEPFYRVDKSRSRAQGGAGLGLSICQEIARLHHTKLQFESSVGHGTIVHIRLAGKEAEYDA